MLKCKLVRNEEDTFTVMVFETFSYDLDLDDAIKHASEKYCLTKEGSKIYSENNYRFTYKLFATYIPEYICAKNGFIINGCIEYKSKVINDKSLIESWELCKSSLINVNNSEIKELNVIKPIVLRTENGQMLFTFFDVPTDDFDIAGAIHNASITFCSTKKGNEIFNNNCGNFNYQSFLEFVPNEINSKFGFNKAGNTLNAEIVEYYEELVL